MAREMLLAGVNEEDLRPDPKPEAPKTPMGKWENFWYHYKWVVCGIAAGLIALAVLIGQAVTKNDPDYVVMLVTQEIQPTRTAEYLGEKLAAYGEDLDGDGTVEVQVIACNVDTDTATGAAGAQALQAHLISGDVMLFCFDPESYAWIEETVKNNTGGASTFFTPLESQSAALRGDGTCWSWAGDPRVTEDAFLSKLPELFFGVRQISAEKVQPLRESGLRLLTALMEDHPATAETE